MPVRTFDGNDQNVHLVVDSTGVHHGITRNFAALTDQVLVESSECKTVAATMWDPQNCTDETAIAAKFNLHPDRYVDIHAAYLNMYQSRGADHTLKLYALHHEDVDVEDAPGQTHKEGTCHVLMEKAQSSLHDRVVWSGMGLSEIEARRHMKAVLTALQHIHADLGMIHMGINPRNLLLSALDECRVGDAIEDFLDADATEPPQTPQWAGRRHYFSPEVCKDEAAHFCRDSFALAVTMLELLSFPSSPRPAVDLKDVHEADYNIDKRFVPPNLTISPELRSILRAMLRYHPAETRVVKGVEHPAPAVPHSEFDWSNDDAPRPVVAQLLQHPYFDTNHFNSLVAANIVESQDRYYARLARQALHASTTAASSTTAPRVYAQGPGPRQSF